MRRATRALLDGIIVGAVFVVAVTRGWPPWVVVTGVLTAGVLVDLVLAPKKSA